MNFKVLKFLIRTGNYKERLAPFWSAKSVRGGHVEIISRWSV